MSNHITSPTISGTSRKQTMSHYIHMPNLWISIQQMLRSDCLQLFHNCVCDDFVFVLSQLETGLYSALDLYNHVCR